MSSTDNTFVNSNESFKEEEDLLVEFSASDIKLPDESKTWDHFMIGQGGFANVYEVRIRNSDHENSNLEDLTKKAALKKFKYDRFATDQKARDKELKKLKREANIIHQISHSNIIQLYGVCYDDHFFGLLLELCDGGSLGNVCRSIKKQDTIALRILANWAHQISSAMKYLTDRKYIHRDLKADNVLVKEPACFCTESETTPLDWCQICERRPLNKLQLKITDFGLSKTTMSVGDSVVGTLVWLAPEVFQTSPGHSNWSEFSDVWSFGVVLWEILAREMPHAGVYPIIVAHCNQGGQTLQLKQSWPQKWKEIMKQCWLLTPTKRPTFESLVQYFEEYTKGLVEVHISDLPKEKRKPTMSIPYFCCIFSQDSKKKKGMNNQKVRYREISKRFSKRNTIIATCFIGLSVFICSLIAGFWIFDIFKPTETETMTSNCSLGYEYFNETGYCYKTTVFPVTKKNATESCTNDNATLASIQSSKENQFILDQYNQQLKNYRVKTDPMADQIDVWLGLSYERWKAGWTWSDGTPLKYANWKFKETINGRYHTILHPKLNGKWGIAKENEEAGYTCKKPTKEHSSDVRTSKILLKNCSTGYTLFESTGFCYKVQFNIVKFDEAIQICANENAHLVSIHSAKEQSEILKLYRFKLHDVYGEQAYIFRTYLWTGLTLDNSTNSWKWTDGSELDYLNWEQSRSSSKKTEPMRTVIVVEDFAPRPNIKERWRDVSTNNFFSFICKKADTSVPETAVIVPKRIVDTKKEIIDKSKKNCTEGYTYFEMTGYCYKSGSEDVIFDTANQTCAEEGGHMVSVHSKEENDFVIDLAKKIYEPERIYTGLYYNGDEWKYTDGSVLDYTNWIDKEPNFLYTKSSYTEDRVTIVLEDMNDQNLSHDKWNNQMGEYEQGYVCKKRAH